MNKEPLKPEDLELFNNDEDDEFEDYSANETVQNLESYLDFRKEDGKINSDE